MRTRNFSLALLLAGGAAFVGMTHAATPTIVPAAQGSHAVMLDDAKKVDDASYMQHLREARTHLEKAKSAFDADLPQRENRKDILEPIDKAINEIDNQIKAWEDKNKK